MINDLKQFDKLKIETIVRQRRETSRGGHCHDPHNFYSSLCGMVKAFFRESVEHQYEDVAGSSKVLKQRILTTVCREADLISKDIDYIDLYIIFANYILNKVCNDTEISEDDIISYDGYYLAQCERDQSNIITCLNNLLPYDKEIEEKYKDKQSFQLVEELHRIIIDWISKYKEVDIRDGKVFIEPKIYLEQHLKEKLHDMFVIPEMCNIEAYKVNTVR